MANKQEAAQARGCIVVLPTGRELFVDIDDADSLATFDLHVALLAKFRPCTWTKRQSPSGNPDKWHAVVTFEDSGPPLSVIERIAYQAVLGSDRLHEILSLRAHFQGDEEPTCFFEKKPVPLPEYEP
jgi:hypothetical protein